MSLVSSWFKQHGLEIKVHTFDTSTHTAQQAADSLGITTGQIVKSILFVTESSQPILTLISGSNRADEVLLSRLVGEPVHKADKHQVKTLTGYQIGGVPPVAHLTHLPTFYDPELLTYKTIWASAGTPNSVFEVEPHTLIGLTQAKPLQ